jgi:hypothetical protein
MGWITFQETMNSVVWPSQIGRLPTNVAISCTDLFTHRILTCGVDGREPFNTESRSVAKICIGDGNGRIPAITTPVHHAVMPPANIDPCLDHVYQLRLLLSTAVRLFTSRVVTLSDVDRAQLLLKLYCLWSICMKIHLKPNHHLAMHYSLLFQPFGPVYVWLLFSFERSNRLLEKVNLNGHASRVMELTLMRAWLKHHHLYELVSD